MNRIERLLRRIDAYQRKHSWLGVPFAIVKKFGDDHAGMLAALLSYYGFLSLFPLVLVFTQVLGFVLEDNPGLHRQLVDSALGEIPLVGPYLRAEVGAISGSGVALVVGLAAALWGGLGITTTAQYALNEVWNVPLVRRPNFLRKRLRSLALLGVFLLAVGASFLLNSLGRILPQVGRLGVLASAALNVTTFWLTYRVLTASGMPWGHVWRGAVLAGLGWTVLQSFGAFLFAETFANATDLYGAFGFVIGLLSLLYVAATLVLYGAEVNAVVVRRLWPRSLLQPPLTGADRTVFTDVVQTERMRPEQVVEVSWQPEDEPPS